MARAAHDAVYARRVSLDRGSPPLRNTFSTAFTGLRLHGEIRVDLPETGDRRLRARWSYLFIAPCERNASIAASSPGAGFRTTTIP